MNQFEQTNATALIIFALFVIVFLLLYIAFGKSRKHDHR